jgi:hypothetical protein
VPKEGRKGPVSSDNVMAVYNLRMINTPHGPQHLIGIEKLLLLHLADAWNLDFPAARRHLDELALRTCIARSRLAKLVDRLEELCGHHFNLAYWQEKRTGLTRCYIQGKRLRPPTRRWKEAISARRQASGASAGSKLRLGRNSSNDTVMVTVNESVED